MVWGSVAERKVKAQEEVRLFQENAQHKKIRRPRRGPHPESLPPIHPCIYVT